MQGIAKGEPDAVRRPTALWQMRGRIDKAGAEVHACHLTAEGGGEIARRAADATTEIEHASRWLEPRGAGQVASGEDSSDMELIEWSELSDGQRLTFGRNYCKRRLDPADEVRGSVVLANFGDG